MLATIVDGRDITEVRDILKRDGCVVVRDIYSMTEVQAIKQKIYAWLHENGVDVDMPETWTLFGKDYFYMSPSIHGMMADGPNMFIEPVVFTKSQQCLVDFCARLYDVHPRQLAMEHGGLFFSFPPEHHRVPGEFNNGFRHEDDEWFHSDACGYAVGREFRSMILLEGCTDPKDHTFVFLSGSHLCHDQLFKSPQDKGFHQLDKDEVEWFTAKGCRRSRVCGPAGSVVIWDHKLIHATEKPERNRAIPRERVVVYGSLIPKETCNSKQRRADIRKFYRELPIDKDALKLLMYT